VPAVVGAEVEFVMGEGNQREGARF
jgi:hypothetical protein